MLLGTGAFVLVVGMLALIGHFMSWDVGVPLLALGVALALVGAALVGGVLWWKTHYIRIPRRG